MKIIIVGAGQVGGTLAENLVGENNEITLVDTNVERLRELQDKYDLRVITGPGSHPRILREAGADDAEVDRRLLALFPKDVRAAKWNREFVQKGMTPAGREFLRDALTAMGCTDRVDTIISVPDLIDFDEGRIE